MKKAIILSCSTGQGHNSCAYAIKEYFESNSVECEVLDSLTFVSKMFADFMSWGHSFLYRRLPGLFRWGYKYSKNHSNVFQEKSISYKMITAGYERLYKYIREGEYDTVICTHVFAGMMLKRMMKVYDISLKTAYVSTDYTCHPGVDACDVDTYFISHEGVLEEHLNCGVTKAQIEISGIPVRRSFFDKIDRLEAKKTLGIGVDNKHILVMCGSMGCGPIEKILSNIIEMLPDGVEVSVICGTNKRLYKKLAGQNKSNDKVHIVGYTKEVTLYMDSADLYITKPGGISVTEAAVKCLPMMFVNAIDGCELYNMNFFLSLGAAGVEETSRATAEKSIELIMANDSLSKMEENLRMYEQPDGAKVIYDKMC